MAKQNVGFGERHLEKLVIGVAGAILAAVVFLFVVQDPYKIDVGGTEMGPSAFYSKLDEEVRRVADSLKRATPREQPPIVLPQLAHKTPTDLATVFVPLGPRAPKPDAAIETGGKLELAAILPPGKPAVTAGRGVVDTPAAQIRVLDEVQPGGKPAAEPTEPAADGEAEKAKGASWIAVFASLNRRAQQDTFFHAQYAVDKAQALMVARVEAERQRLLPSGEWEEPAQPVVPFEDLRLVGKDTVKLSGEGDDRFVDQDGQAYITKLVEEVRQNQPAILRPPFQALVSERAEWKVPTVLPDGTTFDWATDFEVTLPLPETEGKGKETNTRVDYKKVKTQVDDLAAAGKYIEAEKILKDAVASKTLLAKDETDAEQRLTQLAPKIQQAQVEQEAERAKRQKAAELTLGPDVDLLWVTDTSAKPGETYRYRVRVVAVNPYAGVAGKMRNPEDAAKVMVPGQWSEWSEPIYLAAAEHLFLTSVEPRTVKVALYQYAGTEWKNGTADLTLGQPVEFSKQFQEFAYDGVVAEIDMSRPYEERSADRNRVRYGDSRETAVVTLVNAAGDVEEHVLAQDKSSFRDLKTELIKKVEAQPSRRVEPRTPTHDRRAGGRAETGGRGRGRGD